MVERPELPGYVVVEGPIGVGKTALAQRLADRFAAARLLESDDPNPFLERFYKDRGGAALPAQLFFLFERARQLETLRQEDLFAPARVADFLIQKDRLFAELNLTPEELSLYEQILARLSIDAPAPGLVVYLQAPVDVLKSRLRQRRGRYDSLIDDAYLERVNSAYARFFYDYDEAPLLIVNAATIDPVHNDSDFEALVREIVRAPRGRRFFNPVAGAIA
ncbi:MAG: deoxynucleoside kinase [Pseudomonadota bacterium]